jgi:hypothetical protein
MLRLTWQSGSRLPNEFRRKLRQNPKVGVRRADLPQVVQGSDIFSVLSVTSDACVGVNLG